MSQPPLHKRPALLPSPSLPCQARARQGVKMGAATAIATAASAMVFFCSINATCPHPTTALPPPSLCSPAAVHLLALYQECMAPGGWAQLTLETPGGDERLRFACRTSTTIHDVPTTPHIGGPCSGPLSMPRLTCSGSSVGQRGARSALKLSSNGPEGATVVAASEQLHKKQRQQQFQQQFHQQMWTQL